MTPVTLPKCGGSHPWLLDGNLGALGPMSRSLELGHELRMFEEDLSVRHTKGILVRREDMERLWKEDRIAVHFPGHTLNGERDSESLIPADYKKPYEKGVIGAFAELAEGGGYVWAQSYVSRIAKVGYVKGRREGGEGVVMDRDARWEMRGNSYPGREDGHPATLKTLQMEKVVKVEKGKAMHLERVMNLGEVRIEMRIPQSAWFPRDLCFLHS